MIKMIKNVFCIKKPNNTLSLILEKISKLEIDLKNIKINPKARKIYIAKVHMDKLEEDKHIHTTVFADQHNFVKAGYVEFTENEK